MSHDHDHPPHLAHHFETPEQQFESGKLGMWLFLATEVLFFGGLFVAYAILRANHPEIFEYASQYLNRPLGAINTAVLIASSLTMAMGVWAAQTNRQTVLKVCLTLTLLGAVTFMVIKYFEYTHKIHEHQLWGKNFYVVPEGSHTFDPELMIAEAEAETEAGAEDEAETGAVVLLDAEPSTVALAPDGPAGLASASHDHGHDDAHHGPHHLQDPERPDNVHLFFGIYFCMTGLHGIHVLVGIGVIGWVLIRAMKAEFGPAYYTPVDLVGLYWHIVDLIWIFLFPLFYLL